MTGAKLRIVVAGAGGKMGQTLIEGVLADKSLQLAAALDAKGSPAVGCKVGGIKVGSDIRKAVAAGDVLIDFTRPEGTVEHLETCAALGRSIVIGTTGIPESLRKAILQAGRRIPIAMSPHCAKWPPTSAPSTAPTKLRWPSATPATWTKPTAASVPST